MIANTINEVIKIYNKIPKVFELKPNVFGYDKLEESVHYEDGFRELVKPTLEENQYLSNLYFDNDNDYFTYEVITLSEEEISEKKQNEELSRYQTRQSRGLQRYLNLCAEFRIAKESGSITPEFYETLEDTLEPVRTELVNGQFITAKRKLIEIGSSIVTQELYDRFYNSIQIDINELY